MILDSCFLILSCLSIMKIILYENNSVGKLYPVTLTRSSFDIFCGALTLFQAMERTFPQDVIDYSVRDFLRPAMERKYPKKNAATNETLYLDGSLIPSLEAVQNLKTLVAGKKDTIFFSGGKIIGAYLKKNSEFGIKNQEIAEHLIKLDLPKFEIDWPVFNHSWEVVTYNQEILAENLEYLKKDFKEVKDDVYISRDVILPPEIVLNASYGPIVIDQGARVLPFCHLVGPLYVGKNCLIREFTVLKYGCCLGPVCKVGGEIEASVFQGYGNKNHYGFLGYSYLGEWVNLGAGTTTSNLKNNYGPIKVKGENTGQQFMGSIFGDYVRTAINTAVYTGKLIGANSHLYGTITKDVPAFTVSAASLGCEVEFEVAEALKIQKIVMARRNIEAEEIDRQLLKDVFEVTTEERKNAGIGPGRLEFKI